MSMQMDACLKKEQIGTFFVWVGALEGEFGGGWGPSGVSTKRVFVQNSQLDVCMHVGCRTMTYSCMLSARL